MPSINKGESESDYVKRCIPYCINKEGLSPDAAAAKCHGMWKEHKEKGTQYEDNEYFEPPEAGNAPSGVKSILRATYNSCRSEWVNGHPNDKENENNKTSCSKQSWAAVHNAGWNKDKEGNWKKLESETETKTFEFECELKEFSLQSVLIEKTNENGKTEITEDKDWIKFKAVAVIGDRMMKDAFVPYKILKESLDAWNGTIHDINHMATSYPDTNYPFKRQNIEYIVGYQNNAEANDTTKEISMDVNISKNAPKYIAWKSFVDIKSKAKKIPNVSMSINARFKRMKVKDLKFDSDSYNNAISQGYDDEDTIVYFLDIYPKALTTCIEGECNSEKGCGLAIIKYEIEETCNCNDCKNDNVKTNSVVVGYEEYLTSLVEKTKKLKDEKYLVELNEKIKKQKGGK